MSEATQASGATGERFTHEIAGVAAGYVTLPLLVMAGTVIATRFVEPAAILVHPDAVEPTAAWLAFRVALVSVAALVGGVVCSAIARTRRAPYLLAAIVVVMGLVLAMPMLREGPDEAAAVAAGPTSSIENGPDGSSPSPVSAAPPARPSAASFRAALAARPPGRWLFWKPIVSALLILLGARLVPTRS